MNYKSFSLGDWIGHISGVIEDETTLDGNEMRDLVEFLSTLKQEPCEDCISRKAVLDCFKKWQPYMATRIFEYEQELKALPSIQPKPKTGHWIDMDEGFSPCECSECKSVYFIKSKYCPNCGAKMESEDKE